ncbi:MAG TPA: glycosyltransferase family 25 protein [Rhizomicrobium sp.]|nr:glycosyltransferase family 25 protein [Rhizomicrobium sp.]
MRAYLINLERRSDRLRRMTAQLNALGISFERVAALDAYSISDAQLARQFRDDGPLGVIAKGDKCCALSHALAWQSFARSGEPHAVILEDDVALDAAAATLLRDDSWIPEDVDLLKLERYGPPNQRVLIDERTSISNGHRIGRLRSRHTGAAAYIMSRRAALTLNEYVDCWWLPVDHLLFNLNNSPLAELLHPHQMTPAIAHQSPLLGGCTDIEEWRVMLRRFDWTYLKREVVRAYYELRLLPAQIARWLRQESALVRVDEQISDSAPLVSD